MRKILDLYGQKTILTSNLKDLEIKNFYELSEKNQKIIKKDYAYLSMSEEEKEEFKNNYYITVDNSFYTLDDVLKSGTPWYRAKKVLSDCIESFGGNVGLLNNSIYFGEQTYISIDNCGESYKIFRTKIIK